MNDRAYLPEYWSSTMSRRFWLMASLFYLGVLITHRVFIFAGECGFTFFAAGRAFFTPMILVLLLFEWWALHRFGGRMTRRAAAALLLTRMVLFELTSAVDCTAVTTFLYLLVPFLAYLLISRRIGVALGLAYALWFAAYFRFFRDDSIGDFSFRLVVIILSMVFSLAMAYIVKEVLTGQAQERRLHHELQVAHAQLADYMTQVKELAATEERNRLARDIHDSVGHYLAAVSVQLESALAFRGSDPARSEQAIRDARRAASDALREVRRSVSALRQTTTFYSLATALGELVARSSNEHLDVRLEVNGDESGYSRAVLMTLYRVAQEGLTNVQRHAGATRARVTVQLGPESAHLTVQDNGRGIDPAGLRSLSANHQGVAGMRERLALVGGSLALEKATPTGTALRATVPRRSVEDASRA